jgi:hypothetical protein
VSEETARKWKRSDSVQDLSATPHYLQATLSVAQVAVVVELRRLLLLPLDDLLAVTREFLNPNVSRSGLDRCLRRHGVSNLKALLPKTPAEPRKTFKAYEPGFLHVDVKYLPQMADETTRRHLFVAIDRASLTASMPVKPGLVPVPIKLPSASASGALRRQQSPESLAAALCPDPSVRIRPMAGTWTSPGG